MRHRMSSSSGSDGAVVDSAAQALSRLTELDELLGSSHEECNGHDNNNSNGSGSDDAAVWLTYLHHDRDLAGAVARHEATLRQLCDAYVDAHVSNADALAQLYAGYRDCEHRLVEFDTSIVDFQRRLEDSAEHMVRMQQQTDELVRRVRHRRLVSARLSEVYSALQECDRFCTVVAAHGDVDAHYLHALRELDRKLAFLLHNPALQHSAVDTETRPTLTRAARRAGDKLQRYLARTITELAAHEDVTDVEAAQGTLEEGAQFAYHFLHVYNVPVARAVTQLYVRAMSEAHVRWFTRALRELTAASTRHTHPTPPLASAHELRALVCNRDAGAPPGSDVAAAAAAAAAMAALPPFPVQRERSVSLPSHTSLYSYTAAATTATTTSTAARPSLRATTFDDTLRAVTALRVRHGRLHVSAATRDALDGTDSWVWRVVCSVQLLVNRTVAECRFCGNFFCVAGDCEGGADYDRVEHMARAVVGRALDYVHDTVLRAVAVVQHRGDVLAALRVVDVAKQHLCASLDPIPLLLLSSTLETVKTTLRQSLRTTLQQDEHVLAYMAALPLQRAVVNGGDDDSNSSSSSDVSCDATYAATLAPHPLVCRVHDVLVELCLLNVASDARAAAAAATTTRTAVAATTTAEHDTCVTPTHDSDDNNNKQQDKQHSGDDKTTAATTTTTTPAVARLPAYEPLVTAFVRDGVSRLLDLVDALAQRHRDGVARRLFVCNTLFALLQRWRVWCARYDAVVASVSGGAPLPTRVTADAAATSPSSALCMTDEKDDDGSGRDVACGCGVDVAAAQMQCVAARLACAVDAYARASVLRSVTWRQLLHFTHTVTAHDGNNNNDAAAAGVREVVTDVHAHASDALRGVVRDTRVRVYASLGSAAALQSLSSTLPHCTRATLMSWCHGLMGMLVRAQLQLLTSANATLTSYVARTASPVNDAATAATGGNDAQPSLRTLLVSNTTLLYEAQQCLRDA